KMIGDKGRFLKAKTEILQQLRDVEDVVEDAEAVVNQLLDHGRAPAGAAEAGFDWPLINEGGEFGLLRRGEFGRTARGLLRWRAPQAIAAEHADPGGDGLRVHTEGQGDLRAALAVQDCEDREKVRELAQLASVLGRAQVVLLLFT